MSLIRIHPVNADGGIRTLILAQKAALGLA